MRSLPSLLGGIVATLAAIVTIPLLWISLNVQDEDGFVALSSQLATDTELQGAVSDYLAADFASRGLIPAELQETAATVMTAVAGQATNQPGFVEAWEESQRSLHRSALDETSGPVTVDLGPMADFVVQRVGDQLPVSLQAEAAAPVQLATAEDRDQIRRIDSARLWSYAGLMVLLVAVAVCVLGARRRALAIAGLGVGALVAAGVVHAAVSRATPRLIDGLDGSSAFATSLQKLLVDRASDSLDAWLEPIAQAGAVAVGVGVVVFAGQALAGRWGRRA
ncbi:MAG: hypothetical protein ABWX74_14105 [Aeromicrobium sp.]